MDQRLGTAVKTPRKPPFHSPEWVVGILENLVDGAVDPSLLGRRDKFFTHVLAKLSGSMGEVFIPVTSRSGLLLCQSPKHVPRRVLPPQFILR